MQKQLRNNVIFNTAGTLIFFFAQYLQTLMVVWLGGFEDGGLLGTAMTVANVCLSFSNYGMRTFQVSDCTRAYSDRTYLRSRYLTLGAAAVGCLLFTFANSYSTRQRLIILAYTAYRLIEAYIDVWHGFLQRAERLDLVGISFGVRGILSVASFAAGLFLTQDLFLTILIMTGLNLLYALFADLPFSRRCAELSAVGSAGVSALLLECLPLAVYSFLNTVVGSVPKYYCERLLGTVQMGYFNGVFAPVVILQVGATYLFVPFITTFARLWNERRGREFRRGLGLLAGALALLWVCGTVGAALLGRWGLGFLYPSQPEILAYTGLLLPLVALTVITVLVLVLCHLLTIMREMRGLILGNLAGIAASFVASPPLISRFGLYGVAYATLVAVSAQALILTAFLLHRCKKQFAAE